jgi:hypothetical protein
MAWVDKSKIGTLSAAFGRQAATKGNMQGGAATLHHKTMMPLGSSANQGASKQFGTSGGMGNPLAGTAGSGGLGGPQIKSVQSPAQHASVEKAAQTSASRRKKIL